MAVLHDVFSRAIVAQAVGYFKYATGNGSLPIVTARRWHKESISDDGAIWYNATRPFGQILFSLKRS
jgi:hypothetical protein